MYEPWSLIPPWYQGPQTPTQQDIALSDIVLGFFLAVTCFTFAKAVNHTATRWHRLRKFTAYLIMVWVDWVTTIVHSIFGWCVGHDSCIMEPSFLLFFSTICIWTIEMHCQAQILVNRVSLLLFDKSRAYRLKLAVFVIISVLTSSVIIIWTPAQMEISESWMNANDIWDRGEKVCFLVFDVAINLYFVNRVRTTLIENGLTKYQTLYWFNISMITFAILLDVSAPSVTLSNVSMTHQSIAIQVAVIGTTWLPDYWIYIQFRPLTHMVKLYIEMCNAELIGRVAQASACLRHSGRVWCGTSPGNPAVEPISLRTPPGTEMRRQQQITTNGNGSPRPGILRNHSCSTGKPAASTNGSINIPRQPNAVPYQDISTRLESLP